MNPLSDTWRRIAAWHRQQGVAHFALAPGATEAQLAAAERAIGRRLPSDVRASWALHDGGATDQTWLAGHGELLTLRGIVRQWELRRELARDFGVGPDRRHFPVTDNSGNALLIGPAGEVLDFDHEVGVEATLAPSWAAFLAGFADALEAGRYVYFPQHQTVGRPDDHPQPVGKRRFVRGGQAFEIYRLGPSIVTAEVEPSGASMGRQLTPPPEGIEALIAQLIAEKQAEGYVEVPITS